MAYPPSYDNAWDITQPPDTQAANLLGQDIRNLKNDIMQRMSLLSGTLANRPTPETVAATWGGVGYGLLYFATDVSKIYQWNGLAWSDITSSLIPPSPSPPHSYSIQSVSNYTVNLSVAGGDLSVGTQIEITMEATTPSDVINLVPNTIGTQLIQFPSPGTTAYADCSVRIMATGAGGRIAWLTRGSIGTVYSEQNLDLSSGLTLVSQNNSAVPVAVTLFMMKVF